MPRGMFRWGLRTSSPRVVAASKPTKDRMPNTMPSANPDRPLGDEAGDNGSRVRPCAPPWASTIALSKTDHRNFNDEEDRGGLQRTGDAAKRQENHQHKEGGGDDDPGNVHPVACLLYTSPS